MMTNHAGITFNHGGTFRGNIRASSHLARAVITLISLTVFMFVLHLSMPLAVAAERSGTAPAAAKAEAQPQQKPNPSARNITDAAVKAGVKSCADRVHQMTNFLTANNRSGAVLMVPPSAPDKRLATISLGLATPGGKVAYASESFAPNQANGCSGMYETVVYWDSGCPDVAKKQFSTFKEAGILVNSITVLDGGSTMKVFLMPAGTGCVAIKKEVLN